MVHKKSEYRLQFPRFTNDVRAQIWRENIMFREKQKQMNLSDHYWRYQLIDDESCDCEGGSEIDTGYVKSVQASNGNLSKVESNSSLFLNKAVQTPDWEDVMDVCTVAQTDEPLGDKSVPPAYQSQPVESTTSPNESSKNHQTSLPLQIISEDLARSSNGPQGASSGQCHSKEDEVIFHKEKRVQKPVNYHEKDIVHSHLNPLPSRNKLRSFHPDQKVATVFAPFGWNDSHKNVGDQKTYNIRAPINQVHHSALLASSKRRQELELHFAEQLKRKRQHQSLLSIGPVNLSSIWMTEYQENFSRGQREPLRNVHYKPIVWRYT